MSYYHTPGGSNLIGNPHAPRMGETQRKTFMANISTVRTPPDWMVALSTVAEAEAEELVLLEEWEAQQQELQAVGHALGFSCHGPWEDPLACMDSCEDCPFWQVDDIEYGILKEYMAQREHETEKERVEAEAKYVAEYHAWVLEMTRAGAAT